MCTCEQQCRVGDTRTISSPDPPLTHTRSFVFVPSLSLARSPHLISLAHSFVGQAMDYQSWMHNEHSTGPSVPPTRVLHRVQI